MRGDPNRRGVEIVATNGMLMFNKIPAGLGQLLLNVLAHTPPAHAMVLGRKVESSRGTRERLLRAFVDDPLTHLPRVVLDRNDLEQLQGGLAALDEGATCSQLSQPERDLARYILGNGLGALDSLAQIGDEDRKRRSLIKFALDVDVGVQHLGQFESDVEPQPSPISFTSPVILATKELVE